MASLARDGESSPRYVMVEAVDDPRDGVGEAADDVDDVGVVVVTVVAALETLGW